MNADLRAAAQAATRPHRDYHDIVPLWGCHRCEFEALASPDRILALCEENDELRAALKELRNGNGCWCVGPPHIESCEQARAALAGKP